MPMLQLIRFIALITTFFTGLSALVYEVTWQYYLANLLGSQARSTAIILATFLGSLAIGYHLFGALSRKLSPRALVQLCGALEVAIGVWALLFTTLYSFLFEVRLLFPAQSATILYDLVFAAILITPPATAMGATLPLLTQGLSKDLTDAPRFHTQIYAVNTVGAFLGSLLAAFLFIPQFGLWGSLCGGALINLAAGSLLFLLGMRLTNCTPTATMESETVTLTASERSRQVKYQFIAGIAGFVSITLQTVMIRATALSVGSSTYAFSLVVAVCIVMLAVGAWLLAEKWSRYTTLLGVHSFFLIGLVLLYLAVPRLPYESMVIRTLLTNTAPNFWIYQGAIFLGLCALLAFPIGANGALLPLLFRDVRNNQGTLGSTVGILYGRNALGCVLGAVFGGYLSLYYLNLYHVLQWCIVLTSAGTALAVAVAPGGFTLMRSLVPLTGLAIAAVVQPWPHEVMGNGTFRTTAPDQYTYEGYDSFYHRTRASIPVLAYDDDPNSTILVQGSDGSSKSIVVNGKSDGNTRGSDRVTTLLVSHIPALLQRSNSDQAVVIGFGTGITAGALSRIQEFNKVHVLEISPAVKEFAPLFDSENGNASTNSKIEWHLGDAYRYLLSSDSLYGIIASEPSNPWVGGVERLYSKEFYEIAKRKLAPHGLFAQWFHLYSISNDTLEMVLKTFSSVFPHTYLFENSMDLILIGSATELGAQNLNVLQERLQRQVLMGDLKDLQTFTVEQFLARELWVPWSGVQSAPLHTLERPRLSHAAGKDFFLGERASVRSMYTSQRLQFPTREGYFKTLSAKSHFTPNHKEWLLALVKSYCGKNSLEFFQEWERRNLECQIPLVTSFIFGYTSPPKGTPDSVVAALRASLTTTPERIPPADTVNTVLMVFSWLSRYGAPFIPVSKEKLLWYAEPCFNQKSFQAYNCRAQLALTLLANGFTDAARSEYEAILREEGLAYYSQPARTLREQFLF